jgi:hypothetical protein
MESACFEERGLDAHRCGKLTGRAVREWLKNGRPLTVIISDLRVPKCGHYGGLVFDYVAEEQINRACEAQASQLNNALYRAKKIAARRSSPVRWDFRFCLALSLHCGDPSRLSVIEY